MIDQFAVDDFFYSNEERQDLFQVFFQLEERLEFQKFYLRKKRKFQLSEFEISVAFFHPYGWLVSRGVCLWCCFSSPFLKALP